MRYIIGDIHGKDHWKEVRDVFNASLDTCIILGDYFNSKNKGKEVSFEQELANFYEICDWTQYVNELGHGEKVILLYGNHDTQYVFSNERNSGYQGDREAAKIRVAFMSYMDMFKFYHIDEQTKTIYSHAGVSTHFVDKLDELHMMMPQSYTSEKSNGYSPIWIRPIDLIKAPIQGYNQVVGHTPTLFFEEDGIKTDEELGSLKRVGDIWFADTVGEAILAIDDYIPQTKPKKKRATTGNVKIDRSLIMKRAHELRKELGLTMSEALKLSWKETQNGTAN